MGGNISNYFFNSSNFGWRKKYKKEINNMWEYRNKYVFSGGISTCCNVCGGGMVSICRCARQRFINNLQFEDLQYFMLNGKIIPPSLIIR
jgi:hypothetical protein